MRHLALVLVTLGALAAQGAIAQGPSPKAALPNIHAAEFMISQPDGNQVYVRAKRSMEATVFPRERIVLMIHGATFPGTAFDVPLAGKSWMDYLAERGFDVYAVDLPGYGRSSRPPAMDMPADQNEPITRTADAVAAVRAVIEYILRTRGAERLNLIGHSWGTTIAASVAAENPNLVERLVLYAPFWLRTSPAAAQPQRILGSYRVVSREQVLARWLMGVPEEKRANLIPSGWFDIWADATFATDPSGGGRTLRAPNGVVKDFQEYWFASPPKAYWDPVRITAPVLLVVSEWDRESPPYMAQSVYPLFVNAPWKRLTVLSEGTHFGLLERNRLLVFRTVQQFLEEAAPSPEGVE
jgi:pimeloyl-ACP methyl ester carboxylesterase